MSFSYDVMARAWATLSAAIPESEAKTHFGILIDEMHVANHQVNDAINKASGVHLQAIALDRALDMLRPAGPSEGTR